jgi:hypothetical protein
MFKDNNTTCKHANRNYIFVTKQSTCIVIDEIVHTCAQGMGQGLLLQDVKERFQISSGTITQHA